MGGNGLGARATCRVVGGSGRNVSAARPAVGGNGRGARAACQAVGAGGPGIGAARPAVGSNRRCARAACLALGAAGPGIAAARPALGAAANAIGWRGNLQAVRRAQKLFLSRTKKARQGRST